MKNKSVLLCLIFLTCFLFMTVFHLRTFGDTSNKVTPYLDTPCSIFFELVPPDGDFPDGVEIYLYNIADFRMTDGKLTARYTGKYAQLSVPVENIGDETGIKEAVNFIKQNRLVQDYTALTSGNKAEVTNLKSGVYLIIQQSEPVTGLRFTPFIVNLPMLSSDESKYIYSINSKLKITVVTEKDAATVVTGEKLPQTGQLWWPVILLSAVGIVLITIACVIRIMI